MLGSSQTLVEFVDIETKFGAFLKMRKKLKPCLIFIANFLWVKWAYFP